MLFLSPRNSDEAQWSVLQQAACSNILHDAQLSDKIHSFMGRRQASDRREERLEDLKVQAVLVPEEEVLLCDDAVPEFPYGKTPEVARLDPLVTLHTSR